MKRRRRALIRDAVLALAIALVLFEMGKLITWITLAAAIP
jgi:hypothetical protein